MVHIHLHNNNNNNNNIPKIQLYGWISYTTVKKEEEKEEENSFLFSVIFDYNLHDGWLL